MVRSPLLGSCLVYANMPLWTDKCIPVDVILMRGLIIQGHLLRVVESTDLILDTLQTWKRSYGTFLFSFSLNMRLWVDPFCPLEIQSLQDPLCRL